MKKLFYIALTLLLINCNNSDHLKHENRHKDSSSKTNKQEKLDTKTLENHSAAKNSIIVLPPFDEIANAGISPNIQKYLEKLIARDTSVLLIRFPYKKLMNIPYQNVFDKKFCNQIVEKTKADLIVMTKLDLVNRTGNMVTDKWNFQIKIYHVKANKQSISIVTGKNLLTTEIEKFLSERQNEFMNEIKNNR